MTHPRALNIIPLQAPELFLLDDIMGEENEKRSADEKGEADVAGKVWTEGHKVRSYEADPHGNITVLSLYNYLQEAAANHARALGVSIHEIIPDNITWVLSRLAVRVDAYLSWGDRINVRTWPSGVRGPFALRDFLVTGEDGSSVAAAVSAWLLIDTETRMPLRRVRSVLDRLHPPAVKRPLDNPLGKLERIDSCDREEIFTVQYDDLDINRHANSACYIRWIMGSLPPEISEGALLVDLEINYLTEAFLGEAIVARSGRTAGDPLSFFHLLLRKRDGQELLRARTSWKPRKEKDGPVL